ncbi:49K protein [morning glory varicosavirus]|uniref:49K protein n=1 Tax=morning glory varicosavirus TaxID=2946038 RepID=UPI0024834695|nr:49K protein [morning glory varicosavirus]UQZ09617.1 49K protein [morning glory varicosavirus]
MSDAAEMLRVFNASRAVRRPAQIEPTQYAEEPAQPLMALDTTDPHGVLRARLAALAFDPDMEIPEENKGMYRDIPDFSLNMQQVETSFPDNQYLDKEGFYMYKTNNSILEEIGSVVMPMFSSGFNTQGAVGLMILAYNLRAPEAYGGRDIFSEMDPDTAFNDCYGDYASNVQYSGGTPDPLQEPDDIDKTAVYYCYIATSAFRLFTKSPDNYIRAWEHIKRRFAGFYGFNPEVDIPAPSQTAIEGLHSAFSADSRFKFTLYKILYHASPVPDNDGLRRFLYEIHLQNTGLHSIGIFAQLCQSLNIKSQALLRFLRCEEYAKQVDALAEVARMMADTSTAHSKRMWRYGRIFNENFMSSLQTKSCPKFVYILASMVKQEDPAKCQNILQIVQIANLDTAMKMKCKLVGERLLSMIRSKSTKHPAFRPLAL